eukprot:TRINITY_DN20549_c0_g2_i2.p1 TRINITY_DN20549_c0_g2~~TRINITY_DN20549_c0_g2_i2.p1  ORF type:complete len:253 (-),score=40.88 TRINITY_DN20549_c0_g2_i2:359-1117(-)
MGMGCAGCGVHGPWQQQGWMVTYRTEVDPVAASRLLPPDLTPVLYPSSTKVWTNVTYADVTAAQYSQSSVGGFNELTISLPTLQKQGTGPTSGMVLQSYTDSTQASDCRSARWGTNSSSGSGFKISHGSTLGVPYVSVEVKTSSSLFAKQIATVTFYYNKSFEAGQETGVCKDDYQVGNCTLWRPNLGLLGGKWYAFDVNATGEVQPVLSRTSVGSGAGAWSSLDLGDSFIPAQRAVYQQNSEVVWADPVPA